MRIDAAAAKRKAADEAKTALTQAQQNEQQAQTQAEAAAQKLTQAEAQKKSADDALAGVNSQVAAATTTYEAAEKAAQEALAAAVNAKAEADKARPGILANDEKAANANLAEATKRIESLGNLAKTAISLKAEIFWCSGSLMSRES